MDSTATRCARASRGDGSKDRLDRDVLGRFDARISSAGGRAAGTSRMAMIFPKTLGQWINSAGHRNLLLRGASRVGVAV
jgi:hypothetical protein